MALPMTVLWPVAKKLAGQVAVLVASNPDIQRRLTDAGKKIAEVQRTRSPEAKIAKAMEAVREQAQALLDAEPDGRESVASIQAAGWKQRADQVERALHILEHQPRAARKSQLKRIAAMADSLLAEVFTSLIDDVEAESPGAHEKRSGPKLGAGATGDPA